MQIEWDKQTQRDLNKYLICMVHIQQWIESIDS